MPPTPTPEGIAFGQRVRELRLALGMTQRALAECADLSEDSIRRIERGRFSPSLGTLCKLSAGLSLELGELLAPYGRPIASPNPDVLLRQLIARLHAIEPGARVRILIALHAVVNAI